LKINALPPFPFLLVHVGSSRALVLARLWGVKPGKYFIGVIPFILPVSIWISKSIASFAKGNSKIPLVSFDTNQYYMLAPPLPLMPV
jgi:hypothetical protein